ncbi:Bifunctional nuclease [Thalictrum thalictroides]|uniref:Bifunctional nuclease n=1 Tax=Thalictrum thalictroides TaxID=46969 RepID=A0A7J6VPS1_THATH|nr:Bifunctional nuclease [Thalictrum thalictroides]
MLALQLRVQAISNFHSISQQLQFTSYSSSISSYTLSFSSYSSRFSGFRSRKTKSIFISCNASNGNNLGRKLSNGDHYDDDDDYIEAFVMVSETVRHHRLRSRGFIEETRWNNGLLHPFSTKSKDLKYDFSSIGHDFLRRFQSATIFLKIACDGDLLLPIIIGEFAIEKLIDALTEVDDGVCPNHFQFVKDVVDRLGYEVKMVRITDRIVNTYYARIVFSKPGEKALLTVDARPSDAINVAKRCRVPIYVNKEIVLKDAIVYGTRRGKDAKSVYDVSLDSAAEGIDLLAEELCLVRNLNIAIKEERYRDAAILKDKLMKLQAPKYEI